MVWRFLALPSMVPLPATSTPHRRSDATTPHAAELALWRQSSALQPWSCARRLGRSRRTCWARSHWLSATSSTRWSSECGRQPGRSHEAGTGEEITVTVLDSSSTYGDDVETKPIKWEQFDFGDIQILPPAILGWIMLRRSGLPASSRLSVLSAIKNKLDLDTMERAMRDQEEELLLSEAHHRLDVTRPRRSFWIEEDGERGSHHWGRSGWDWQECSDVGW